MHTILYPMLKVIAEHQKQREENIMSHKQDTTPTFEVYQSNGSLKDGLKYCFITNFIIDCSKELPSVVKAGDGKEYKTIYDSVILPSAHKSQIIRVIGSFQQWENERIVIIRNFTSKKGF